MTTSQSSAETLTPDKQIAAAMASLEALKRERDAYLKKQEAADPLRKFDERIAAAEAELKAGEDAKRTEAAKMLALELRKEAAAFVDEAVDLQSALADAGESGANLGARLKRIHELQGEINVVLGRSAPNFPSLEQVRVMTDIGFRSVLQDSVFSKHVERLSSVDRRDIAVVVANYGRAIEANWIAPFTGEARTNETEAA